MVEEARGQIDDRDQRCAPDGRSGGDDPGVRDQQRQRHNGCTASSQSDWHERRDDESGEYGDVAAGDRDDVVRACRLQARADIVGQPAAIADQHGRDDRSRQAAVAPDALPHRAPDVGARVGRELADDRPAPNDVDQEPALD